MYKRIYNSEESITIRFSQLVWLKNEPSSSVSLYIQELFRSAINALYFKNSKNYTKEFDKIMTIALEKYGCSKVSRNVAVSNTSKYNIDLLATAENDMNLAIEIEKSEVKRVIHDILKIAAVQRSLMAIGILIVPETYTTESKEFSRTHLQEARAVLGLLELSHAWQGGSLAVVTYKKI